MARRKRKNTDGESVSGQLRRRSDYVEAEHPRGPGGRWVDKPFSDDDDLLDRLADADLSDMGPAPHLITSQHFLDEEIVRRKIADSDFDVFISPKFEVGGETFQVVRDGHHSLAAAIATGNKPNFVVYNASDDDIIGVLDKNGPEAFLEAAWMDSEYIYAVKRNPVW